jgi:putative membrane protein
MKAMNPQSSTLPSGTDARTPASVVGAILAVSVVASLFIFWLVYVHPPVDAAATSFRFLPGLNAHGL